MSKTKEETMQQWREALKESAGTAVEALSAVTPLKEKVEAPTTDEASKILGQAMLRIRELMRPAPKTVAFLEEEAWYRMKGAAKPAGEYRTPKSAIDFVTANPPLDIPPAAEPIDPNAPKLEQSERHMSYTEASAILMELARNRTMSVDQVTALEMGTRRMLLLHFQRQRNWARRRAARSACGDSIAAPHTAPLSPEEELADTITRQKEADAL